jgi:YegS/Rv2252/BmrU family lipid kinase
MTGSRIVLVVNPRSQNGQLGRRWAAMAAQLRRQLGGFEDVLTRRPGDATRLARQAVDSGADLVVAVGGDGTINEVANGFFRDGAPIATSAALGVLPYGTGGDFRKTAKLSRDLAGAARVLAAGVRRHIDVGRLDYTAESGQPDVRMFINIASFGISGLVDRYVNSSSKLLGGAVSFALATARAGVLYQNQRVRLWFDDDRHGIDRTINTVAVANGRYFGGGMMIAPDAELDDGLFDVVTIGDVSKAEMLLNSRRIYQGTHLALSAVFHQRARRLRAEPLGPSPVHLDVDGETPGRLPATFAVLPKALSLVVAGS